MHTIQAVASESEKQGSSPHNLQPSGVQERAKPPCTRSTLKNVSSPNRGLTPGRPGCEDAIRNFAANGVAEMYEFCARKMARPPDALTLSRDCGADRALRYYCCHRQVERAGTNISCRTLERAPRQFHFLPTLDSARLKCGSSI